MNPILVEGPAVEPVPLDELRAWLRLDDTAEDDLVTAVAMAARALVERISGRILIAQTWRLILDRWPSSRVIVAPVSPLIAVTRIRVYDALGQGQDVSPGLYHAHPASDPPRLMVDAAAPSPSRPHDGIEIDFRAGFGTAGDTVPAPLLQAIRVLAARWFEKRGDAADATMPADIAALVAPFRRPRL